MTKGMSRPPKTKVPTEGVSTSSRDSPEDETRPTIRPNHFGRAAKKAAKKRSQRKR